MGSYKTYFRKIIADSFPDQSKQLLNQIESTFNSIQKDVQFASHSSNPMDKRMEIAGYFLATIKALDKQGESLERIREILLAIAREYVRPKNGFQRFLKKLPARIVHTSLARMLFRRLDEKLNRRAHPDGFVTKIITDRKETLGFGYGIDIIECGICKLFEKHNYKKVCTNTLRSRLHHLEPGGFKTYSIRNDSEWGNKMRFQICQSLTPESYWHRSALLHSSEHFRLILVIPQIPLKQ